MSELEKLTLNDTKIKHPLYLAKLNKLANLNIKGCKYNKILIDVLKNKFQIDI